MNPDITAHNQLLEPNDRLIADTLASEINKGLPEAESKIYYRAPAWLIDGNPIVTYNKRKAGMCLMFWSGQSFDEPNLKPEGKFKAAEIFYTDVSEIDTEELQRWLQKSQTIQWDYKNLMKRKGELLRLSIES